MDFQWRHIPRVRHRSRSVDSISTSSSNKLGGLFPEPPNNDKTDFIIPHTYPLPSDYNDVPTFPERPHFEDDKQNVHPRTLVVAFDGCPTDPHHPAVMPIYQTATFVQPSVSEFGPYDYTRSGNPTRTALETLVGKMEGAYAAFAFSTGMAALSTIMHLLKAGDEVLACSDLYGGMHRLLTQICERQGIKVKFADTTNITKLDQMITSNTALVHVETPSNPLMRITDLHRLSQLCNKYSALLSVDSTMMSPVLMKPLKLGADIVMHSATKFLNGHSDTMAGILATTSESLAKRIAFLQNAEGTALAPFDCWLVLRGMKTMCLRVERQQENARIVANFLLHHPLVQQLNYVGLHRDADVNSKISCTQREYDIHHSQSKGPGSVISFTTGNVRLSQRIVDAVRLFKITVSFGSCNSLIEMPCLLSHASIPSEKRTLPSDLIRLSIGIEDAKDIVDDLSRAFRLANSEVDNVRKTPKQNKSPKNEATADETNSVGSMENNADIEEHSDPEQ